MSEPLHFSKAPITEALFEVRVKLPETVTTHSLREMYTSISEKYQDGSAIYSISAEIMIEQAAQIEREHIGYRFESTDKKTIVQSRKDLFAFHRLFPYENWDSFISSGRHLWELYCANTQPIEITRLGLRYINRIDIPDANVDLKDYFRTTPEVSGSMPQLLNGYYMQLVIPYPDYEATLVLNQFLVPPPHPNITSIVLDIDVFHESSNEPDDTMWERFARLRQLKNDVFLASLTPKAQEMLR